jgi:hypothetical protein
VWLSANAQRPTRKGGPPNSAPHWTTKFFATFFQKKKRLLSLP